MVLEEVSTLLINSCQAGLTVSQVDDRSNHDPRRAIDCLRIKEDNQLRSIVSRVCVFGILIDAIAYLLGELDLEK